MRLAVAVDSVRVAPAEMQPPSDHRVLTTITLHVAISNPAEREAWASECSADALDADGHLLSSFRFQPGGLGGAYLVPGGAFDGRVVTNARAPLKNVRGILRMTDHIEARCAALDWGDFPPV